MVQTGQDFTVYAGDDNQLSFAITAAGSTAPLDLTGATIYWTVAVDPGDNLKLEKSSTGSDINITSSTAGTFTIDIQAADTESLGGPANTPSKAYFHQVRIVDSSGEKSVLAVGTMTVKKANNESLV